MSVKGRHVAHAGGHIDEDTLNKVFQFLDFSFDKSIELDDLFIWFFVRVLPTAPADVVVRTDAARNPTFGQNKKVLLIDFDQQASLTETYATLDASSSTENIYLIHGVYGNA